MNQGCTTRRRTGAGRGPARKRRQEVLRTIFVLMVGFLTLGGPFAGASPTMQPPSPFETAWERDLAKNVLETPTGSERWTAAALSADGAVLVAGSDDGVVAFFEADPERTGSVMRAFHAEHRGPVTDIALTADGARAAIRYGSGFMTVLDHRHADPLLSVEPPEDPVLADQRTAIGLTGDGRFAFTTGDAVTVHYSAGDGGCADCASSALFDEVGAVDETTGPYIYVHPSRPIFGVLSEHGRISIFSHRVDRVDKMGEADLLPRRDVAVTAFGVSGDDGRRLALGLSNGTVIRYLVDPAAPVTGSPFLRPEYHGRVDGAAAGVLLSHDGMRLAAWGRGADAGVLWSHAEPGEPVHEERLGVQGPAQVSASVDLYRLLVRDGQGTRLYNLPERDTRADFSVGQDDDPAVLDEDGGVAFLADRTRITAYGVKQEVFPAPAAREATLPADSPAEQPDATGPGLGFGGDTWLWGIGILALVLVPLMVAAAITAVRRRPEPEDAIVPLAATSGAPAGPLAGADGGATAASFVAATGTRAPPPVPLPPETLLAFDRVVAVGHGGRFHGLDLRLNRPDVVRIEADTGTCVLLSDLLSGRVPVTGDVSVTGVSLRDTPFLFARRVQSGVPPVRDGAMDAETLVRHAAAAHGLPASVVRRRLEQDLRWLPAHRRRLPYAALDGFERWKVRLVLALVHRPDVLVLGGGDLPEGVAVTGATESAVTAVRQVLRGVSRHYRVLVLLLDDGRLVDPAVARWSDELLVVRNGRLAARRRPLGRDGRMQTVPDAPARPSSPPVAAPRGRRPRRRHERNTPGDAEKKSDK